MAAIGDSGGYDSNGDGYGIVDGDTNKTVPLLLAALFFSISEFQFLAQLSVLYTLIHFQMASCDARVYARM